MMSGIRGKDTKPELIIRKGLHAKGFRYRLHVKILPGKPDLVFQSYRAVILIHGCFWHAHSCHLFKWPQARAEFWKQKISANSERDVSNLLALEAMGWRVLTIWECSLRGSGKLPVQTVIDLAATWLKSGASSSEIGGQIGVND